MKNPVVSVVTVCFNAARTIEDTILSVIRQSYKDIEYIIIDGGSKDGTVEIVNRYKEYLSCFISEKDKGIYDAMNKGIKAASGEWIIFRNSGDYFANKDVVKNMFADIVDDNVVVLHGICRGFDQYGYYDKKPPIQRDNYSLNEMPVLHPSTFIRLSYHKQHLFNIRYKSSSDFDFFTKCSLNECRYQYKPILVSVMNVGEGMSVDNLRTVYKENFEVLCENHVVKRNLLSKASYYTTFYNLKFRELLKKLLPHKYVEAKILRNKVLTGWIVGEDPIPTFIKEDR